MNTIPLILILAFVWGRPGTDYLGKSNSNTLNCESTDGRCCTSPDSSW